MVRRVRFQIPPLRSCHDDGVTLTVEKFGTIRENLSKKIMKPVRKFKWINKNKIIVEAINYGATITSIQVPDRDGNVKDIVLGCDNMDDYINPANPYFGATVGRACNRIARGFMSIDGKNFDLSKNEHPNMLHGGFKGFDKVLWIPYREGNTIILSYHSKDGEEGFPGDLNVNLIMYLTDGNEFVMEYQACTTKPTYVNLCNHSYFNLAGHDAGAEAIYQHKICINGEFITQVDKQSIPTGKLIPVGGTVFDFRIAKLLKERLDITHGFDHNYCVTLNDYQKTSFVAKVSHPPSGRGLEMYSNQPGIQFYTANGFPELELEEDVEDLRTHGIHGKESARYFKHGAFALETQNYPDAINHPDFPPSILYPGNIYLHSLRYIFLTNEEQN